MNTIATTLRKLCHAHVGQKVRIPDPKTGEILPEIFVVVAFENSRHRPARKGVMQGLYDDQRDLQLVSLTTGLARKMPHLSSKAELLRTDDWVAALSSAEVPVLAPESPAAWCQLELVTGKGSNVSQSLNMAEVAEVRSLLTQLQQSAAVVASVVETEPLYDEAQLLALWRGDVANGLTLLSFEEYKKVTT